MNQNDDLVETLIDPVTTPAPEPEPLVLNTLIGIGVGDSPIVDLVTDVNNKQCQLQCENWLSSRNNNVCIYNKEVR